MYRKFYFSKLKVLTPKNIHSKKIQKSNKGFYFIFLTLCKTMLKPLYRLTLILFILNSSNHCFPSHQILKPQQFFKRYININENIYYVLKHIKM